MVSRSQVPTSAGTSDGDEGVGLAGMSFEGGAGGADDDPHAATTVMNAVSTPFVIARRTGGR